jgi:hypothetical protein
MRRVSAKSRVNNQRVLEIPPYLNMPKDSKPFSRQDSKTSLNEMDLSLVTYSDFRLNKFIINIDSSSIKQENDVRSHSGVKPTDDLSDSRNVPTQSGGQLLRSATFNSRNNKNSKHRVLSSLKTNNYISKQGKQSSQNDESNSLASK